ncbi:MAG: DUF1801 domain-containing protein [Candidatus Limnocylindrales bacterium]
MTTTAPAIDQVPPEALLADYPPPMVELAERLRRVVREAVPEALERVRVGWRIIGYDLPVGRHRTVFFAWIMTERVHVHLGFPKGILLDDHRGLLSGNGITKQARWLTADVPEDIDTDLFVAYTREAAALSSLSQAERFARQLDREVAADARR